jgi:hypothetical protein
MPEPHDSDPRPSVNSAVTVAQKILASRLKFKRSVVKPKTHASRFNKRSLLKGPQDVFPSHSAFLESLDRDHPHCHHLAHDEVPPSETGIQLPLPGDLVEEFEESEDEGKRARAETGCSHSSRLNCVAFPCSSGQEALLEHVQDGMAQLLFPHDCKL